MCIFSLLSGCNLTGKKDEPPRSTRIGQVSKFDINITSRDEIADALKADHRVVLSGGIFFEFDSAKINENASELVRKLADVMKENPDLDVAVVGYTDNTGDFHYNIKLSERRANAMVEQLIEEGVAADRLAGVGIGPLNPIATNNTPEGQAENRRVELVLIH